MIRTIRRSSAIARIIAVPAVLLASGAVVSLTSQTTYAAGPTSIAVAGVVASVSIGTAENPLSGTASHTLSGSRPTTAL